MPIFTFYPETRFGGDFKTEAAYKEVEVECSNSFRWSY